MFRTNYLPKGEIFKDSKTGKYFFELPTEGIIQRSLVENKDGYYFSWHEPATMYDTIDEIIEILYKIAAAKHLENLHRELTYKKGIKI